MASIEDLEKSFEGLSAAIDRSNAEKDRLRERLRLIERAALNRIDGDSPQDTHWSEIVGIAEGDPNWLQHAKANYDVKHARLVELASRILESVLDGDLFERSQWPHVMADMIEEELLPEMFLAEDGRTFLRGQGKPYPPEDNETRCPRCQSPNWKYEGDRQLCADCGS